jgi:hypothetical protein
MQRLQQSRPASAFLTPILLLALSGLLLTVFTPSAAQTTVDCTHYVSLGGSDQNLGSQDLPWASPQHAADSAQPGDVICLVAGGYDLAEEGLTLTRSGTQNQPITLTSYNGAVNLRGGVTLEQGASHLRLHGFTVTEFNEWGITLTGDNEDITLSDLEVSGGEAALRLTIGYSGEDPEYGPVNDITVRDSIFHDNIYTVVDCTPGPCNDIRFQRLEIYGAGLGGDAFYGADGLAVERGHNILVEDCYIHDNSGDGIDLNSRDLLLGDDAGQVIVRRNRVTNGFLNGIKLWRSAEVSNNLVWNMGEPLLVLERGSSYIITNNTFANLDGHNYLAMIGYDPFPGSTTVELFNNIFYNDNPDMGGTTLFVSDAVDLSAGHNLYYNPYREEDVICLGEEPCFNKEEIDAGTPLTRAGFDGQDRYGDPLFVDAANGDFHLSNASPALDAGSLGHAPNHDLEESPRPSGGAPDIGAYEGSSL